MDTPRGPRAVSPTALVVAAVAAAWPAWWFVRTLLDVPGAIVLAAVVPAAIFTLAIAWIDRAEPEPWPALAAAVAAGAVVASCVAHFVNAELLAWVAALSGAAEARPLAGGFGAPIVEEIAKAAVLVLVALLARGHFGGTRDGIVYGALVGIGFAFTENVVYLTFAVLQGGPAGLVRGVYVRALLGGGNHAAFTATTGAALGWAWGRGRPGGMWLVPMLGLALAMLQHVVWNAVAAVAIQGVLCGPELPGGPCRPSPSWPSLVVTVPMLTAIFIGPALVTLGAIAVSTARRRRP